MNKKTNCIYGLGENGIHIYLQLKKAGIEVDFFADINPNKKGYVLDGKYCIEYDNLIKLDKKTTIIIIGVNNQKSLVKHFTQLGFSEVYSPIEIFEKYSIKQETDYRDPITDMNYLEGLQKAVCNRIYKGEKNNIQNTDLQDILNEYQKRIAINGNTRS